MYSDFNKKREDFAGDTNRRFDVKVFGSNLDMGLTNIVKCTKCGSFMLTKKGQKSKTCTYCGTKVNLLKAQKVASADSAFEASEILKILKSNKGFKA